MLPTRALVVAPVMMAKLGVVTVSVMQTSLVQHVRNVFLENLEVTVQVVSICLVKMFQATSFSSTGFTILAALKNDCF